MLGATALEGSGVRFAVWAPRASRVSVCVRRAGGELEVPLADAGGGHFAGVVGEAARGDDYLYRLDGGGGLPDPASRHQPHGVHGPSRVAGREFPWTDAGWTGVERADLVLYELHVGTFSDAGTFEAVIPRLAALRELGIRAVELMPVAQFPGARNWGYDGVFPFAPQDTYGGPLGLRRLVDAAHAAGLAVLLDVVYNHLGPEGNVLAAFGPYFTDRYRTPWGDALNFDGPDSDEVRRFFVENALHWIDEYHLDGLRLDAVHAICDTSPRPFLAELAEAVGGAARRLGRGVHLIAESDANDPRLVRSPERGGIGLDAVWSDDFHHAVHARLTGERRGYYADYGRLEQVAKALRGGFVYDGVHSEVRRRRHGARADDLAPDRFVVCVQNHDQVGNRARGERLASLLSPPRLRVAAALLLLSPNLPLLFMGEEYGERRPFLYFVSHGDPKLVEAVRRGRRAEFASFAEAGEVPDPAAEETFERSRLRPACADAPEQAGLAALYRALLGLRSREPALRPGGAGRAVDCDPVRGWIASTARPRGGRAVFAAFQLGEGPAALPAPKGGPWRLRLATEDARFGGAGSDAPQVLAAGQALALGPDSAAVYAEEPS